MRGREFIAGIAVSTAMPLAARAQPTERARRIGVLLPFADDDSDAKTWLAAFQQGLKAIGGLREIRLGERATLSS